MDKETKAIRNRARVAVHAAVRNGKLKKEPCADCGTTEDVQGHHTDYSKALEVVWLCSNCHWNRHQPEMVNRPRCPKCKRAYQVRFRNTLGTFLCGTCGHTWAKQ